MLKHNTIRPTIKRSGTRRAGARLVPVLTATLLLAGCIGAVDPRQPEARLQNATDATVEVYLETDDFSTLVNTIDPGEEGSARVSFGESGCQTNPLVARTTDGVEVDRHEGICVDEVWVIDGDEE